MVESQLTRERFKAEFNLSICSSCSLSSLCQLKTKKKSKVYYFTPEEYLKRKRIEHIKKIPKERRSLRTNIETTVSEFTRKMNNRKLKLRGLFKAQVFAYTVGIGVNFGRINRYLSLSKPERHLQLLKIEQKIGQYFKERKTKK